MFLNTCFDGDELIKKIQQLSEYIEKNVTNTLPFINLFKEDLEKYNAIKAEILVKMQEADALASTIRTKVMEKVNEKDQNIL